jgi:hypothetical protein
MSNIHTYKFMYFNFNEFQQMTRRYRILNQKKKFHNELISLQMAYKCGKQERVRCLSGIRNWVFAMLEVQYYEVF